MGKSQIKPLNHLSYANFCPLQAKSYARSNIDGTEYRKNEADRSSVSDGVKFDGVVEYTDRCQGQAANFLIEPQHAWVLVLGIFYFSNLLVPTTLFLKFQTMFVWLQGQSEQIKVLYKASATVLTCINIITLISDLYIVVNRSIYSEIAYNTLLLVVLTVKVLIVLLILIIETPMIFIYTHSLNQTKWCAHAFAFCQIIWFVHRLINAAIISVVFFILAPAQTLAIVTLLLFTIGSAIAFVALTIYNCCS